jgi:hypothetical protein
MGGLRMLETDEVVNLGITTPTNYLTGNVGGGMKWFASRHWGARADHRLMIVNNNTSAPGSSAAKRSGTATASMVVCYLPAEPRMPAAGNNARPLPPLAPPLPA